MNWLMHADTGQTTAGATRMGAAEPRGLQQKEDINYYALAELDAISAYITRFRVIETIMMRDRRDVLVSGRTGVEEHVLAQETYFILSKYTGGASLRGGAGLTPNADMVPAPSDEREHDPRLVPDADTGRARSTLLRVGRLGLEPSCARHDQHRY